MTRQDPSGLALSEALSKPDTEVNIRGKLAAIGNLLGNGAPNISSEDLLKPLTPRWEKTNNLAMILARLSRIDRYERRARSRLKFAARAFDETKYNTYLRLK
jgi:hypothetical protein